MHEGRASGTARLIAAATVLASHVPDLRGLTLPEAAAWCARFLSTSAADRRLLASATRPAGRACARWVEARVCPGVLRHWMLRKRTIESIVRPAAAEGFTTLIVVGAGLDTLAFRLAAEGVFSRIVELDHPATQAVLHRVTNDFALQGNRVELIPIDLAQGSASQALHATSGNASGAIVIIEGLLMYLEEQRVRALLGELASLPFHQLRIVATSMNTPRGEPIGFRGQGRLVRWWLRKRGEVMRWSLPDADVPGFLAGLGYRWITTLQTWELPEARLPGVAPLEGESIFVADRL